MNAKKESTSINFKSYEEAMNGFVPSNADYYENPDKYAIAPFCIFGNLYYVGDRKVCMHLIDTGEGLILFDSGYSQHYHGLIHSIQALGFSPADIKILIHSHGHFDHFGGGDRMREAYGTKVYMSAVDTTLLRQMPQRALMNLAPRKEDEICYPDIMIEDGEEICLGNTRIQCVLSPGHTPGTMSFFFDATDGKQSLKVGYFGGVGFLTVYKEHLKKYDLDPNMLDNFKNTIQSLKKWQVDIVIGNHPNQNDTLKKRRLMLESPGENPFIDSNGWQEFLDNLEARRAEFQKQGF